jgi:alpha-tubulin suppressor-like RCC1 family protein
VISVASNSTSGSYCALLSTGKVDCWGYNDDGELGNGTTTSSDVPVAVVGITNAKAITEDTDGDAGSFCALLSTSQVKCWGYNDDGELGNGTTTTYTVPVAVKNITTAAAVIGGYYGFCALLSTSQVDCWGYNRFGELGNGNMTDSDVPVAVHKITNADEVISGYYDFCALLSTSHIDCWGYNEDGELGNGTTTDSDVPVAVVNIANAKAVASDSHSGSFCALLSTSHIDCWGYNEDGELGNGTTTSSDVPVAAVGITNAKAITEDTDGGSGSFCAVLSTSHVDCWGYNDDGELGNGTTTTYTVPVAVKNITTAATVIGGDYGFCALLSNSHIDCWGYNRDGELGNGNMTDSDVPVAVHKITNAAEVTSGNDGYCALLSTSHVDCWGYNGDGELGNGNTTDSDVPVAVLAAS